jgi:hypothetical protein
VCIRYGYELITTFVYHLKQTDMKDTIYQLGVQSLQVKNETGLTPRELQKSHAELLEALKYILEYSENLKIKHPSMSVVNGCAKQAINNATPKQ